MSIESILERIATALEKHTEIATAAVEIQRSLFGVAADTSAGEPEQKGHAKQQQEDIDDEKTVEETPEEEKKRVRAENRAKRKAAKEAKEKAAKEETSEEDPFDADGDETETPVTLHMLKVASAAVVKAGFMKEARAIISGDFGVKKLVELPEEDYAKLLPRLEALLD